MANALHRLINRQLVGGGATGECLNRSNFDHFIAPYPKPSSAELLKWS